VQRLKEIEQLIRQNRFIEAEALCEHLLASSLYQAQVSQALIYIYMHSQRQDLAFALLEEHCNEQPANRRLCDQLANLYAQNKDFTKAANCYQRYLQACQNDPEALFNLAFNQRHAGQFDCAITHYQLALEHGVSAAEEVLTNMAVIYADHLRDEKEANAHLLRALGINPHYIPAIYNLANLHEQAGKKEEAKHCFAKILSLVPDHFEALARLADLSKFNDSNDPLIQTIKSAAERVGIAVSSKIDLLYGLGKALNDCGDYEGAFVAYQQANTLNKTLLPDYIRPNTEQLVKSISDFFCAKWFEKSRCMTNYTPIFICGMFRSGSTLVEQILAAHPEITAGGEQEFFVRLVANELSPFPEKIQSLIETDLAKLASEYVEYLRQRFPAADHITDKRSDNFLYIGLIKTLFPKAKIIFTERHPIDNSLSVYFQRLGKSMNYATDLGDIAHYYRQQQTLMTHWQSLFADSIFTLKYDDLIAQPEANVRQLLDFLGLDWSSSCLEFYKLDNYVKTASVWQVRQPLYNTSSGRWKHFKAHIPELVKAFTDPQYVN
jgi:tetratricopeptide (TPR) repeat protein